MQRNAMHNEIVLSERNASMISLSQSIQSKPRAYYILLTFCTILDAIGSTSKLCHMARDRREVPEQ